MSDSSLVDVFLLPDAPGQGDCNRLFTDRYGSSSPLYPWELKISKMVSVE
jgi:hypothetical protein